MWNKINFKPSARQTNQLIRKSDQTAFWCSVVLHSFSSAPILVLQRKKYFDQQRLNTARTKTANSVLFSLLVISKEGLVAHFCKWSVLNDCLRAQVSCPVECSL